MGSPVVDTSVSHQTVVAATRFLRQAEMPLTCNRQVAKGSFPEYGWSGNLPAALGAEKERVLTKVLNPVRYAVGVKDLLEMVRGPSAPSPS